MLVNVFHAKNFSCFKESGIEIQRDKPIKVIIGRNNSGKSQVIELVEKLCDNKLSDNLILNCEGVLEETVLKKHFPESRRLSSGYGTAWDVGKRYVGKSVRFTLKRGEKKDEMVGGQPLAPFQRDSSLFSSLSEIFRLANVWLIGKRFRRINADRDIVPEKENSDLSLRSNGGGATNLVRKYISSSSDKYPRNLIEETLRQAMNLIFGDDGHFDDIVIQHHDSTESSEGGKDWEIYLEEKHKGDVRLSNSGSGIKTVLLVLLNTIVYPYLAGGDLSDYVFAFEELENNLHPALLRRLFSYLEDFVKANGCELYLTTHSSVALDYFGQLDCSQIIRVSHDGKSASAETISTHFDKVQLIAELGCKPSDLLQANGIIWVEGPSDRMYINRFIELYSAGEFREGIDYQCAFYGGSVLAKIEFSAPEEADTEFANLLRLNHNVAVLCDGDRTSVKAELKPRVQQKQAELAAIPGSWLWITEAKEIENYIPGSCWAAVYKTTETAVPDPRKYDCFPAKGLKTTNFVCKHFTQKWFDKVAFATAVSPFLTRELLQPRFDLNERMISLIETIKKWNGGTK